MLDLSTIKNIIFDLGGVLLNLDFNSTKQAFIKLGIVDFNSYYNKVKQKNLFDAFEVGKINEVEFCEQLRVLSKIEASDFEIIEAWNSMLLNFPTVRKDLLIQLKANYNISLLSNTNETHVRGFNKIIQKDIHEKSLAPLFHSHYFSNEIGYRKPNPNSFEFVLKQNNYLPSETLFLDDSPQHIKGAEQLGIKTFHVTNVPVEELFANFLT